MAAKMTQDPFDHDLEILEIDRTKEATTAPQESALGRGEADDRELWPPWQRGPLSQTAFLYCQ
jgi:hypothetical protein